MSKNSDNNNLIDTILLISGCLTSSYSGGLSWALFDETARESSTVGGGSELLSGGSQTSSETPGLSTSLTGAVSTSATSAGGPDGVLDIGGERFNIFTENKIGSSIIEDRASKIYDTFDKNHKPGVKGDATLVASTPEVRKLVEEIIGNKTPAELYEMLTVLERILNEEPENSRVLKKIYEPKK